MKIVVHSPTQLIIRDNAMGLRAGGVFVLVFGAFVIAIGMSQDVAAGSRTLPVVIGSVVAFCGVLFLVLPSRKTFAFSKSERVFIIAKQRFGRVEREIVPLHDVADVSLEESRSSDSGSTYRICVTLADQRRIPWTSYYTSGVASKRAVVDLVRQFLELDPNPGLASGAPTAQNEREARRGRVGLYVMAAFCSVFLAVGATLLVKEQRRLALYRPIEATVLSTRIQEHSDSDGSTYEPVVVYRYRVQDREYTASRVTPLKESRGGGWARRVIAKYEVGATYTAFYDPENPGEAFLLRSRSVIPWAFVGIPLVGLLLLIAGIRGTRPVTASTRAGVG
jgi:hypothetical protein